MGSPGPCSVVIHRGLSGPLIQAPVHTVRPWKDGTRGEAGIQAPHSQAPSCHPCQASCDRRDRQEWLLPYTHRHCRWPLAAGACGSSTVQLAAGACGSSTVWLNAGACGSNTAVGAPVAASSVLLWEQPCTGWSRRVPGVQDCRQQLHHGQDATPWDRARLHSPWTAPGCVLFAASCVLFTALQCTWCVWCGRSSQTCVWSQRQQALL